jgi:hypothetical protein
MQGDAHRMQLWAGQSARWLVRTPLTRLCGAFGKGLSRLQPTLRRDIVGLYSPLYVGELTFDEESRPWTGCAQRNPPKARYACVLVAVDRAQPYEMVFTSENNVIWICDRRIQFL